MTAQLAQTPVFKAFDNNGLPLFLGQLFTYAAGTTTPQATYVDSTQTTQNTNPVILNARGEANVWLNPMLSYKFVLQDSFGNQIWAVDNIQGALSLSGNIIPSADNQFSLGNASFRFANGYFGTQLYVGSSNTPVLNGGIVGYWPQTAAEIAAGVTPTNYAYAPGDVRRYGADPTGVADSTTALQNWIKTCESDTIGGTTLARLPAGVYKISNTIKFTRRFVRILGDGPEMTSIQMTGVAADVFSLTLPASGYWQPIIEGFSIDSDSTSLYGFNLSALTGGTDEMYRFAFRDLYTYTGKAAIYCTNAFAGVFENWHAGSANDHCFKVACGPGVVWNACYATNVGTGKAGFRLLGEILMLGCNGINSGDFWGVFGQDPTAGDGFSNDFPGITDYPAVQMFNCNVEAFAQSTNTAYGIELHNSFKLFRIEGGKIDRSAYATQYGGMIRCRLGPFNSSEQLHVGPAILFQGAGVAKGPTGAVASGCEFYADVNGTYFEDSIGTLVKAGYAGFYSVAFAGQLPFLTTAAANDVYQDSAYAFSAIAPRRLSLAMERFAEPAALTPVGAAQNIDVTGYTKVIVTPAAAASVSSATFTQTIGAGLDYKRNGRLIIEAGNANLTINHSAAGAYTFHMSGAANLTLVSGQVVQFLYSETTGQWWQV